jgi:uncharacterized protein YbaP (TraB family)
MHKRLLPALFLCIFVAPVWAQVESSAASSEVAGAERILIVGQRPGPGLWKISKGDHVLWIFGTYSPLPNKMVWRSQQVETVIAQSQEFLGLPAAGVGVGFSSSLNLLTALPFLVGIKKNPDGGRLQDVVPADVYARWTALKQKYIGANSSIETDRPIFAAQELYEKALEQSGLGSDRDVIASIKKIAQKNKLPFTSTGISVNLENPRGAVRDFKKSSIDDLACFTKTIDRLEIDLEAMRVRANAWAIGDVDTMRKLTFPDQKQACDSAVINSAWTQSLTGGQSLELRVREAWLAAAEKSLANNRSTFALLPVSQIMSPTGMVAALQAKGYAVEQPD